MLVSNTPDCGNNTAGTSADTGNPNQCRYIYGEGHEGEPAEVDIKSMQFVCYGDGIANVTEYPPIEGVGAGSKKGAGSWKTMMGRVVVLVLLMVGV